VHIIRDVDNQEEVVKANDAERPSLEYPSVIKYEPSSANT
jgi:hypothetical protein